MGVVLKGLPSTSLAPVLKQMPDKCGTDATSHAYRHRHRHQGILIHCRRVGFGVTFSIS